MKDEIGATELSRRQGFILRAKIEGRKRLGPRGEEVGKGIAPSPIERCFVLLSIYQQRVLHPEAGESLGLSNLVVSEGIVYARLIDASSSIVNLLRVVEKPTHPVPVMALPK